MFRLFGILLGFQYRGTKLVSGKLKSRSYEDSEGVKRYVTEVEANEILLLGVKNGNNTAE